MSKLTAAYIAGIIDGEGYLGIQKQTGKKYSDGIKYEACIKVGMTDQKLITWLQISFGGNIHHRIGTGKNKDSFTWTLRGNRKIKPFLDKVYPYLRIKREQADVIRRYFKTFYDGNRDGYKLKKSIKSERDVFCQQIRSLNHRGKACTVND